MRHWLNEPKILQWVETVARGGAKLRGLKALRLVRKRNGELLFGLLNADMRDPQGHAVPPVVLIRGQAVVIVPLLRCARTGEQGFLVVKQWRIGNGALNIEFPAGMLDTQVCDPLGVAVKELHEETSLDATRDQLHLLHPQPLCASVGLLDEAIWFYGGVFDVSASAMSALRDMRAGHASEQERIITGILSAPELREQARSMPVHLALDLFERWYAREYAK